MKILGMDSSGLVASVSVWSDGIIIGEYTTNNKKTHSQTLLPMIDAMLSMLELEVSDMDGIAVAEGPGSFTGLRIGAATAKGLGGALHIPVIPVPTLEGLAYNCSQTTEVVCPIMDARRKQGYYGIYEFEGENLRILAPQSVAPIEEIVEKVNAIGKPVRFLGDGIPVFRDYIEENVQCSHIFAMAKDNYQKAGSLVTLAAKLYEEGKMVEAKDFAPVYLRLSQAERERLARGQAIE